MKEEWKGGGGGGGGEGERGSERERGGGQRKCRNKQESRLS